MTMELPRSPCRDVHGFVLLDKPLGISSNAAMKRVKRLYRANKAGHTGSLDPLATGLLPVCLGDATKMSAYLLEADKAYRAVVMLGLKTTTGDAEGEVIATRPVPPLDEQGLRQVLARFVGQLEQVPPMFSAVKLNGRPLYKLAHKGIEVERPSRTVVIHALTLLWLAGDTFEIQVRCSKGTYIRTLTEDIGEALGCGAHVAELRRTAAGPFDAAQMLTFDALDARAAQGLSWLDSLLLPVDSVLTDWPDVCLADDAAHFLRQGQPVFAPQAPAEGWVKLYTHQRQFLGIGCMLGDGRVAPKRLMSPSLTHDRAEAGA